MPSIDPRLKRLAARIGALIDASPYLPADVARELGVDKSSVSRWITGTRTPSMQNLIDLAALLGVEVTDFWEGQQAYPSTPEQRLMLEKMASMTPEQQQALLAFVAATAGKGG
jgi:transcriptional regulator with XRE-family HTH domain